jgi:hypothetical protein
MCGHAAPDMLKRDLTVVVFAGHFLPAFNARLRLLLL